MEIENRRKEAAVRPLFFGARRTRKAVKKTCRWHVFRPWESPSTYRRIRKGVREKERPQRPLFHIVWMA